MEISQRLTYPFHEFLTAQFGVYGAVHNSNDNMSQLKV